MLEHIPETLTPSASGFSPMNFDPKMLDDVWAKSKKHKGGKKKHGKRKKSDRKEQDYAQLAFQYGVLSSHYNILTRMVELSISAKRGTLNDDLLDSGMVALGRSKTISLPEP